MPSLSEGNKGSVVLVRTMRGVPVFHIRDGEKPMVDEVQNKNVCSVDECNEPCGSCRRDVGDNFICPRYLERLEKGAAAPAGPPEEYVY